jgi:hypothetical protein
MKILVHQILVQNKKISFSKDSSWAVNTLEEAIDGKAEHCEGELTLHRREDRVRVTGDVVLSAKRNCDICGGLIEITLSKELALLYDPQPEFEITLEGSTSKEEELVLEENDLDLGWYEDGQLDLSIVLSEHIILNLSNIVQCSDENVKRLEAGKCQSIDSAKSEKEPKNTYKPFANLNI